MIKLNSLKLQKKQIAFFTVVPLMLITALVRVPDPVCSGTGTISNTGMSQVVVGGVYSNIKNVYINDTCLNYRIYNVDVTLTLQNNSDSVDADGFVKLVLIYNTTGKVMDEQVVVAQVPALSRITTSYSIMFMTLPDAPIASRVDAAIMKGVVPDKVCNGSGTVPLNAWPFYRSMVSRLTATQRIHSDFQPRVLTDSELEELLGQEGNTNGPGSEDIWDGTTE